MYNLKINMNKTTIKRKQVSSTIESYKKCTKINKTFGFQDLSKKKIKQPVDDSKLGKFNVNNLMVVEVN